MTRLVILESPFAGRGTDAARQFEENIAYSRQCLRDCLLRGEAPMAGHLLYTLPGVLDDDKPEERKLGMAAGLAWGREADATVVYTDRGISDGMMAGIARARRDGRAIDMRSLYVGGAI